MLRLFSDVRGLSLRATDGECGTVKDAYFDDHQWTLRYLVVTTGSWLSGRNVLISPASIKGVTWDDRRLELNLTREQIKNAPDQDSEKPVSRQYETQLLDYYGYPYYWSGSTWGGISDSGAMAAATAEMIRRNEAREVPHEQGDPHLRSAKEVAGYAIQAVDDSIGQVDDFLFDDSNWSLRYFLVDTRKWLPGRRVLIATDWILDVNWDARKVEVGMSREEVRSSPEFDASHLSENQEHALYQHYGRKPGEGTRIQIR
jgi:uncharacterized protein YrrD